MYLKLHIEVVVVVAVVRVQNVKKQNFPFHSTLVDPTVLVVVEDNQEPVVVLKKIQKNKKIQIKIFGHWFPKFFETMKKIPKNELTRNPTFPTLMTKPTFIWIRKIKITTIYRK